jgi:DNA (cytosine-5)-methyltransferase 1
LLDLFCGAGGAAMGYHRAGFDVVGVDIKPQPHYPFEFWEADAVQVMLTGSGRGFDAYHASPPCQAYTNVSNRWRDRGGKADGHPDLVGITRTLLKGTGPADRTAAPWVLENVPGSPVQGVVLHGGMFGLGVQRPRLFESNQLLMLSWGPPVEYPLGVYGERPDGRWLWQRKDGSRQRAAASIEEARVAMGIDWMDWRELAEAIPPAYTEWIGAQLIRHLEVTRESEWPGARESLRRRPAGIHQGHRGRRGRTDELGC